MDSSSRRQLLRDLDGGGDDLEEGEYVPGLDDSSDTDDEDGDYRFQPRRVGDDELHGGRMRRLEDFMMASGRVELSPPRSPTLSSCESDGTISDDGSGNPSAGSSLLVCAGAPEAARFACHVCGRRFGSPKAVDGHMRVHGNARHHAVAAVVGAGGWAATGKRGWTGGKPYSLADATLMNPESTDRDIVAARPLEPVPMAIAMTSLPSTPVASTRTNLSSGGENSSASAQPVPNDLATVVTGPNSSTVAAVVSQQAAPPAHAPAQAQLVQQQPLALASREYSCKLCGKTYTTHQGLGGHAAGHRNRQKEAAAAGMMMMVGPGQDDGAFLAALRRGGRRGEERHECQKCHKVFATGVALGGHMRMHYTGPPIVHKKSKRRCLAPPPPVMSEADLRLALSTLTEERPSSPAPAVAAGRVRLFGIDIGPQQVHAPSPPEEEGSSGTVAEGSSSGGERQQ